MHVLFAALAICVVVGLIEAQMDRRGQQNNDRVRTRSERRREEEAERRRREEEEERIRREREEQRRRQEDDRRRREEEERQRRQEAVQRAREMMQRRLDTLTGDTGYLRALQDLLQRVPETFRPGLQAQIHELQERIRAAEKTKPEE